MFSLTSLQPQILTAVSELTTLINLPRICVSMPTRKQHTKTEKHSQVLKEKATQEDTSKNKKLFQHLQKEITIKELYPFLAADFDAQNTTLNQLGRYVQNRHNGDLWRETFVSAETFFENKTGFPEWQVKVPDKSGSTVLNMGRQNTELHRFLQATVQHLFFQQNRQFKTKRSVKRTSLFETSKASDTEEVDKDSFKDETFFQSKTRPSMSFSESANKDPDSFKDETFLSKTRPSMSFSESANKDPASVRTEQERLEHVKANTQFLKDLMEMQAGVRRSQTKLLSEEDVGKIFDKKQRKRNTKLFIYLVILYLVYSFVFKTGDNAVVKKIRQGIGQDFEVNPMMLDVTFDDVRGASEAKQELLDIVEFLKNPDKFTSLGGKLPKGVLLVGPPGTGKTLLARAVAGEAGVPFLYCSGSDFDKIFVGSGTVKVKMLFEKARQKAPCVIFIDEIDSVARKRTGSDLHPYANQTINSLLSEIDGFNQSKGVIIIGATNRLEDLDKAVLRPGRFDIQVKVHTPDLKERIDILELYLGKVVASKSIDVLTIARGTPSFTGADLESLVNKAALRAAYLDHESITMEHIEFAKDNILMGPAKKNKIDNRKSLKNTAIHEGGHTVVAYYTKHADPLNKVTIIPRGQALGFTSLLPEQDVYNLTKSQLLAKMDVCMGGRVAEELINGKGEVTTGATSDFQEATRIATSMVKNFGMSDEVGVRYYPESNKGDHGMVDKEIDKLLQESYKRAKDILQKHADEHKRLVEALMSYETLDAEQIKAVIEGRRLRNVLRRQE